MQRQITIHGSRVHDVGYRLHLLLYAKKFRFIQFEAFNDIVDDDERVVIYVEGDEERLHEFIDVIQVQRPDSAMVTSVTINPYDGLILPLSSFSQDLQMEQMAKSVPILVEMRDMQYKGLSMHEESLSLHKESICLQKETLGLQKETISLQKESLKKQDETLSEIRDFR